MDVNGESLHALKWNRVINGTDAHDAIGHDTALGIHHRDKRLDLLPYADELPCLPGKLSCILEGDGVTKGFASGICEPHLPGVPLRYIANAKEKIFNCSAKTLQTFGLTGKYDVFKYICNAFEKILTNEKKPHFQSIYSQIAKEQNVSNFCVERDIRYAIKRMVNPEKRMKLTSVFGDFARNGKFSNSRFLTMLAADIFEKLFLLESVRIIKET